MVNQRRVYPAQRIGHAAAGLLGGKHRATLRGNTSKGVYIQTDTRWIIFLSFGRSVGPLSVTLEQDAAELDGAHPGAAVEITGRRLYFPDHGLVVDAQGASVWRVPSVPAGPSLRDDQLARATILGREAVATKGDVGFSGLLPYLLWPDTEARDPLDEKDADTWLAVSSVRAGVAGGDAARVLDAAGRLVGKGRGLTPSGDDFLLGMSLALKRWDAGLLEGAAAKGLMKDLVALVYGKTTSLSANLIECAAQGEADERLLGLVDSIYCGIPSVETAVGPMLTWGSSSGVDALTGMIVAVLGGADRAKTDSAGG